MLELIASTEVLMVDISAVRVGRSYAIASDRIDRIPKDRSP